MTRQFEPDNHIVPYEGVDTVYTTQHSFRLGRVLKVYLLDPRTTSAPVSTEFSMLMSGVHCGYEHGTSVWIRYLFPPPRYTAEVWDANRTYAKDEVVYSPLSGECYRSRTGANQNHDPSSTFQRPPLPPDMDPPLLESDITPEIIVAQQFIAHDPGFAGQTKILSVATRVLGTPPEVPDPVLVGTFLIQVYDFSGLLIGQGDYVVSGSTSMTVVTQDLVDDLVGSLPGTFTVSIPSDFHIRLEDLSQFRVLRAIYTEDLVRFRHMVQSEVRGYIPPRPEVVGQPQITWITFNGDSAIPGAIFRLTMIDAGGDVHSVEYASGPEDNTEVIIEGILAAIDASTDVYWESVDRTMDGSRITLSVDENASTDVAILLPGSPWWEWNAFPMALADQVIRGAYADLLKEWGQTDKGALEEQGVPQEAGISAGDFDTTPNPPLSGQQRALSRYKL